jgi:biotin transport system substrate-specific component
MAETLFKQASLEKSSLPGAGARIGWQTPVAVVAATGFVALCAHITIPLGFTPVPLSMAPFAVLLVGLLFSPGAAVSVLALYLAEGASGLPVFAPLGAIGMAQLLGPTGGYLLSYPAAAALASVLYRYAGRSFFAGLLGAAAGGVLILTAGAAWLAIIVHTKPTIVFAQAVTPFLPGDLLKVIAAAGCARLFESFRGAPRKSLES